MFQRLFAAAGRDIDVSWAEQWSNVRLHRIATKQMVELDASSKLNAECKFPSTLREEGRACTEAFLAGHAGDLGQRSTYDIGSLLDSILEQV
ncbi:hypothetical protein ACXIUS_01740 [Bosea thiooxidans]|nr:hypothetical protein [Bosea sp. (in: a-proteobacteria)]